jgi:hypothetical protein
MRSILLALIVVTGIVAAAQTPQPWTVKIQPLQLAAEKGSNGPQLSVSKKGALSAGSSRAMTAQPSNSRNVPEAVGHSPSRSHQAKTGL